MSDSLYRKVLQDRQDLFNQSVADGIYTPFIYPWDTWPVLVLLLGVAFTPRLSTNIARISRYALAISSLWYCILRWPYVRTCGLTSGYGIGLAAFWGYIMTIVLMVLHDPGKDFSRIEVRKTTEAKPNGNDHSGVSSAISQNGSAQKRVDGKQDNASMDTSQPKGGEALVWQGYPMGNDLWYLLDWVIDLCISFRGINWNWRIPIKTYTVTPPEGDPPVLSREAQQSHEGDLKRLQRMSILNFFYYWVLLDLFKTTLMTDPYFLGIAPLDAPTTWPWLAQLSDVLPGTIAIKFVRLSLSIASVVSALTFIFSLNSLFFGTIVPYFAGDKLYSITKAPLLEVWMYPPQWGNMLETLCNKGLAGMWATWWHQMFRYGISEPARLLTKKLNISPRGQIARVIQMLVAFGLTASIHAVASSTTFSLIPSKPWNPFTFFMSQAIGILVQTDVSRRLNKLVEFPKVVRQSANFVFAFTFLWYTGPLLSDDFARCQIWLFEPVPVSIFRGLGFGPGDCWVPWLQFADGARWLGVYRGKHWYTTGLGVY